MDAHLTLEPVFVYNGHRTEVAGATLHNATPDIIWHFCASRCCILKALRPYLGFIRSEKRPVILSFNIVYWIYLMCVVVCREHQVLKIANANDML